MEQIWAKIKNWTCQSERAGKRSGGRGRSLRPSAPRPKMPGMPTQFPLAKGGHIRYTDGDKNMVRMMASGETAQAAPKGIGKNSQAKVPVPDETPKTKGARAPADRRSNLLCRGQRIFQVRRRRRAFAWRASVSHFLSYQF